MFTVSYISLWILDYIGPYLSDGANSDANIFNSLLRSKEGKEMMKFLLPGDHLILDRGFRDSQKSFTDKGIRCSYLGFSVNGKVFSVEDCSREI